MSPPVAQAQVSPSNSIRKKDDDSDVGEVQVISRGASQVIDTETGTQEENHTRSPLERSLVFRLDCFLMVFGCISQVIKYLDQVS